MYSHQQCSVQERQSESIPVSDRGARDFGYIRQRASKRSDRTVLEIICPQPLLLSIRLINSVLTLGSCGC
nr:hypothetical protein CFP56_63093 [Quercus suber]